jgi:hypothetical protein
MTKFDQFKLNLKKAKLSGQLLINKYDGREVMVVALGWGYPDSAAEKVFDIAEKMKLPYNEFEVCAEISSPDIIKKERF